MSDLHSHDVIKGTVCVNLPSSLYGQAVDQSQVVMPTYRPIRTAGSVALVLGFGPVTQNKTVHSDHIVYTFHWVRIN